MSKIHQRHTRILVTGGAGFIGSHTVDRLLQKGVQVTVLDNLSQGKLENIKQHTDKKNFSFVQGDIRDPHVVKETLKDTDAVIHLAAMTSPKQSFENPHLYNEINIQGTLNLLDASLKSNVDIFICASSAAVYGNPKKLPVKETHPLQPLSPYGITKITSEAYTHLCHQEFGLKTVVLRYFNAYGPRQTRNEYAGVITKFLDNIKNNQPLTIFGDGNQTRDFIYVKDIAEAHVLALTQKVDGETFNIGTGTATTINKLATTLLQTTNKTHLKIAHTAQQKGDIKKSVADISKARAKLHFQPTVILEEGLRQLTKT